MAISLTSTAAERVQKFLDERRSGVGLRISVRTTGCSGFAYVVDFAESVTCGDTVCTSHGVQIVVDAKSLPFVDGTEVDYSRGGLTECFQFKNPNVTGACGCGESFAV